MKSCRTPSASDVGDGTETPATWERSQSFLDLEKKPATAPPYHHLVSEESKVYWDLSRAAGGAVGKQKEVKFKQFEDEINYSDDDVMAPDTTVTCSSEYLSGVQERQVVLQSAIEVLKTSNLENYPLALRQIKQEVMAAWSTPVIGRKLAYILCDTLRLSGGLTMILDLCKVTVEKSLRREAVCVLEQVLTVDNREYVVQQDLRAIMCCPDMDDLDLIKVMTGILGSLFKTSSAVCKEIIAHGALPMLLKAVRYPDNVIRRHCAVALCNLALFSDHDTLNVMVKQRAADWLFTVAFNSDDNIQYYALLAVAALCTSTEHLGAVVKSGTLDLVYPFTDGHDPELFSQSDPEHIHGESSRWLDRLVPLLSTACRQANTLAAFHFAMEAHIKGQCKGHELDQAIPSLVTLASGTHQPSATLAARALKTLGHNVPYRLPGQVHFWTNEQVLHWVQQKHNDLIQVFKDSGLDGDMLLLLTEDIVKEELKIADSFARYRLLRSLRELATDCDLSSVDTGGLHPWLCDLGMGEHTYRLLHYGVNLNNIKVMRDEHLKSCGIINECHRNIIVTAATRLFQQYSVDCFISYRRSTAAPLASLLKVHLQLRGFSTFIDIEQLGSGKFDFDLLDHIRRCRVFVLILTAGSLDSCVNDLDGFDWIHREVATAIGSGRIVVPVTDGEFQWPDHLPPDMASLSQFNGVKWVHEYQDACVDKIARFVTCGQETPSRPHSGV